MLECQICNSRSLQYYPYNARKINLSSVLSKVLPYFDWLIPTFIPKLKTLSNPKNRIFSGKIVVCGDCGYGVMEKIPSSEQLAEYYNYNYWTTVKTQSEPQSTDYDFQDKIKTRQIDFMSTAIQLSDIQSMLEIGAGAARSSILLKEKYKNITENDICESGLNWKEYYESNNLNVVSDFFPKGINKKYDLIYASHWLEHVGNLDQVIQALFNSVSDSGYLYIEVPNCNDQYWMSSFPDIPHTHFFTQDSLCQIFQRHGFKPAKVSCAGPLIDQYIKTKQLTDPVSENAEGMWLRAVF